MKHVSIIAEIGCNHQGSFEVAKQMIKEAKSCGCDYVKLQKRDMESIPIEIANKPYIGEHSFGNTYIEHRKALEFSQEQWEQLKKYSQEIGIGFFGTAFDYPSAIFLCNLDLPYLKIGSGQIRDIKFLQRVSEIPNKPTIIMSIGMCTMDQFLEATYIFPPHIVLQTTSSYPCPETEVNLNWLKVEKPCCFEYGLSGHYTAGNGAIEAAAVALGATYIERHFTLDRSWKGTDQAASLEPIGMINIVKAIRSVERALGDGIKKVMPSEIPCLEKITGKKYNG